VSGLPPSKLAAFVCVVLTPDVCSPRLQFQVVPTVLTPKKRASSPDLCVSHGVNPRAGLPPNEDSSAFLATIVLYCAVL
jgi:hypothetical protein